MKASLLVCMTLLCFQHAMPLPVSMEELKTREDLPNTGITEKIDDGIQSLLIGEVKEGSGDLGQVDNASEMGVNPSGQDNSLNQNETSSKKILGLPILSGPLDGILGGVLGSNDLLKSLLDSNAVGGLLGSTGLVGLLGSGVASFPDSNGQVINLASKGPTYLNGLLGSDGVLGLLDPKGLVGLLGPKGVVDISRPLSSYSVDLKNLLGSNSQVDLKQLLPSTALPDLLQRLRSSRVVGLLGSDGLKGVIDSNGLVRVLDSKVFADFQRLLGPKGLLALIDNNGLVGVLGPSGLVDFTDLLGNGLLRDLQNNLLSSLLQNVRP